MEARKPGDTLDGLGKGVWMTKSDDSDETVSPESPGRCKKDDFVRDCQRKRCAELQKRRFRTRPSRKARLGKIKCTISCDTVKKSRRRESSGPSKSDGFGRDCQQKHESVRKRETHFGTTVSAKSYIFEHEGPRNLKKRPFSICAGRRLSKTSGLRNRATSQ